MNLVNYIFQVTLYLYLKEWSLTLDLKNKSVLVTGATGMIGRQLIDLLKNISLKVKGVSLDLIDYKNDPIIKDIEFIKGDLRDKEFCEKITKDIDFVFHVAGIKGSPKMTLIKPYTFFYNTMLFNLNMIEASRKNQVSGFLYTSTIGVYSPSSNMSENQVWKTFPSENDKFAGWAKRMGELQIEGAEIEFGWKNSFIVRPANVFGPWDNFDPATAMVIPSLISRIERGENPLLVWGDGTAIRDFVYSRDVARAMLHVVSQDLREPINIGSGSGTSISELTKTLKKFYPDLRIEWDLNKPTGDRQRLLDSSKLYNSGFKTETTLEQGLEQVLNWVNNRKERSSQYNAFHA